MEVTVTVMVILMAEHVDCMEEHAVCMEVMVIEEDIVIKLVNSQIHL
jgi:hypothetical protein